MLKIVRNPNKTEYEEATAAVIANDGYCPCALSRTEDYKCMCKAFKNDLTLTECFCGRYIRIKTKEKNNGIN